MSFLRGSENYVWCTTSVLGKGATGAVFQGVNKNNGEPVAVKTFNQVSHLRPHDVQMREFEVLRKVKHENIVKLLAIEEEQEGHGKVIVMELCTGGSLFNILDDPENTYGLQEDEFLLVLEHLTAGMKHLRDNNLVHRDLKPGNIMKFINEDGTTTYKLTDFGAARELREEEQFLSLYGTEEYLHPDMYERAVLRKPVGKSFGATVDLWSIGVTLYHVATGQLPFRPYGGRRNKDTMFFITTKKASGVISGTQTTENGPIDWSRELPSHCQLSAGLKKLVTPLLAGLLEVNPHRIWSFEMFFSEVQTITSTKAVYIFHVNTASSIKSYPATCAECPLLLFNKNDNKVSMEPEPEMPKFPEFPAAVSCVTRWGALVAARLRDVARRADALAAHAARLHDAARALDLAAAAARRAGAGGAAARWAGPGAAAALAREADALRVGAAALAARHAGGALRAEWDDAVLHAACPAALRLPRRSRSLLERLRDSWQHLVRDRATRALTYNDEQFHVLERITVAESGRRVRALLARAAPLARARHAAIADWTRAAHTVRLQATLLDKVPRSVASAGFAPAKPFASTLPGSRYSPPRPPNR
ncbi:unnamed protein product [Leptidea sinapis]|uniref:Protein kinase domain-containing protein n=1 Tax=Leptidea sinapis TaxID=189913 RepID=A0A5E4QRG1_9NEOP|nr:unnamed protein product [Leptidea sinapis]